MRLDLVLLLVVVAMVGLVGLGYPLLAVLAGFLGVLFIGSSGERYKRFEAVEVPPPGGYPKWEFWKDLLKESGSFIGKQMKTFLRTEQIVDNWSSWLKKSVYKGGSGYWFMYGPYAINVSKDFVKALTESLERFAELDTKAKKVAIEAKERFAELDTKAKEIANKEALMDVLAKEIALIEHLREVSVISDEEYKQLLNQLVRPVIGKGVSKTSGKSENKTSGKSENFKEG